MPSPKVSYFTPLRNTPVKFAERTAHTVLSQLDPRWEWALLDDSDDEEASDRLRKLFEGMDPRVKYRRMKPLSGGSIGVAKRRAAMLCEGEWLAELDHDDLIMPELTGNVIKHGEGYDFVYTNLAVVNVGENGMLKSIADFYPGAQAKTVAVNPLSGLPAEYVEFRAFPVNAATIRFHVSVAVHARAWRNSFYLRVGGHCGSLAIGDDSELVARTFVSGARMLRLDWLGYLQTWHEGNSSRFGWDDSFALGSGISAAFNEAIRREVERRTGEPDPVHAWLAENTGFQDYDARRQPGVKNLLGLQAGLKSLSDVVKL